MKSEGRIKKAMEAIQKNQVSVKRFGTNQYSTKELWLNSTSLLKVDG